MQEMFIGALMLESAPAFLQKPYGIMPVGKTILGVLEKETEARYLIENIDCGKYYDPGDCVEIAC